MALPALLLALGVRFSSALRGRVAALLTAGLCLLSAAPARAQLTKQTMPFGGMTRTWYVHVPASYDGTRAVPLVIVLHGVQNSGDQFAPVSEWTPVSDQQGFIVVYPNGGLIYGPDSFGWNDFVYDGSAPDDVGFLVQLIQTLAGTYKLDADRVYMTGFSNGASMTNTFCGNGHTGLLAATATCSGDWLTTYGTPESVQHPGGTVSTWITRGSLENFTEGNQTHAVQDANQTAYWVGIDGCNQTPQTLVTGIYTTSVYTGGKGEVRFSMVAGYNHQYGPGFAQKIWNDFFSRTVRNVPPAFPPASAPAVPQGLSAGARVGVAFSYPITASNSPTSYAAGPLPDGLSVDPVYGVISGTPTTAGTSAITLQATNAAGTGTAVLKLTMAPPYVQPAFFEGEVPLGSGVYYLQLSNGNPFGYYSYLSDPDYLYHFDLGYEYAFDAADGEDGVYLYDFASGGFFYTSPGFPFPYLYDFNLGSVVYYYPDPNNPGHYNTDGTRYFYVFNSGQVIGM